MAPERKGFADGVRSGANTMGKHMRGMRRMMP